MNVLSISLLFILVFLSFLIPVLLRRHVWKRLSLAIAQDDFDTYFKVLDSFISKISFPAFYRENIRLSAYITQNKEELVKKQINFMETEMRLKGRRNNKYSNEPVIISSIKEIRMWHMIFYKR